jgi:hypothetical protein
VVVTSALLLRVVRTLAVTSLFADAMPLLLSPVLLAEGSDHEGQTNEKEYRGTLVSADPKTDLILS